MIRTSETLQYIAREEDMPSKTHVYRPIVEWTGNTGSGTSHYRAYERAHVVGSPGKADILGSSDPSFRGDGTRWSPEDLFVASVSTCHQLWYLHLCAKRRLDRNRAGHGIGDEAHLMGVMMQ